MRSLAILLLCVLPLTADKPGVTEHRNGEQQAPAPTPKLAVTLPAEVRVRVGQLLRIEAEAAQEVTWDFPDSLAAEGTYEIVGKRLILPSERPGVWIVRAWVCEGSKPVKSNACRIVIEGATPPEPGPGPDPGPGPVPSDFRAAVIAALKQDGPNDAALRAVVEVLKLAIDEAVRHETAGAYRGVIGRAMELAASKALPVTRDAIEQELKTRFPADDAPLDLGNRAVVVRVVRETAAVLEGIKPGPVPPGPKPPSPPDNTLEADLASAFAQDVATGGGTVEDKAAMAGVYREGVNWLPQVGTLAEFAGELGKLNKAKLGTRLPQTRKVVGAYLNKHLPTDPNAKLDDGVKAKLAAAFKAIADALGRIGRSEQRRAA